MTNNNSEYISRRHIHERMTMLEKQNGLLKASLVITIGMSILLILPYLITI